MVGDSVGYVANPGHNSVTRINIWTGDTAEAAVGRFGEEAPPSALAGQREWIDACYAGADAENIVRRLRAWTGSAEAEAAQAADTIEAKSPTSVKVTLESLRRVAGLS